MDVGRIPEETVAEVLEATDIVDLIGSYFPLKRAGSVFKCLCPFHHEKTPSFNIDPTWQNFRCFGCGESGNAIGFVMKYENLPFVEAVLKLAQRANISIIEEAYDPEADQRRRKISRLKEINNYTARFFHHQLLKSPDAQHARDYMKSRGFDQETAKKWLIGWAPKQSQNFLTALKEKEFNGREIINSGLGGMRDANNARAGLWVKFYDQLTFPIHNDYGDVVGFSARVLRADDKRGKYINTNDTALFNKSALLFALDKARKPMGKEKFALICEGQVDAIVLHEAGFENTVAPLGTAFTEQHARLLKRYTDHVTLCYDGDAAGLTAADKAFTQLTAIGFPVKLMHLPEGHDPDTFLKEFGVEKFQELLTGAQDFFEAKLDKELPHINLNAPTERAGILQRLAKLVSVMSDDLLRDATIQTLAIRMRLGADDLRQIVIQERNKPTYPNQNSAEKDAVERVEPTQLDPSIAYLCHLALKSSAAADELSEQLETIPDQLALEQSYLPELPSDPQKAASETITLLLSTYFQKKESALRSQLADPNLPQAQLIPLLEDVKKLQEFLKNLDSRFIR